MNRREEYLRNLAENIAKAFLLLYDHSTLLSTEKLEKVAFRLGKRVKFYCDFHNWSGEMSDRMAIDFNRTTRKIELLLCEIEKQKELEEEALIHLFRRPFSNRGWYTPGRGRDKYPGDDCVPGLSFLSYLTFLQIEMRKTQYDAVTTPGRFPKTRF